MNDHFLTSEEFDRYQRDLEIHTLNMKMHVSEEGHAIARGRKVLRWNVGFAVLAITFSVLAFMDLLVWHQDSWWWLASWIASAISIGFAIPHRRHMKAAKKASEAFRSLEPPSSLRPLSAAIDAQIEEEEAAEKAAKKRKRWRWARSMFGR